MSLRLYEGFDAWVLVTPEMAKRWIAAPLPAGVRQRPVKNSRVSRYSVDRLSEDWNDKNPEPIILVVSGAPIEGQHRLRMVVATGLATRFKVVVVADDTAREIMPILGTGLERNPADVRHIMTGSKTAAKDVALARTIMALEEGSYVRNVSPVSIHDYIEKHADAIRWATSLPKARLAACVLGAMCFCYPANPSGMDQFARMLIEGANVPAGHPVLKLQKFLKDCSSASDQLRYDMAMRTVCAAYHHLQGNGLQQLKVSEQARDWFTSNRRRADSAEAPRVMRFSVKNSTGNGLQAYAAAAKPA